MSFFSQLVAALATIFRIVVALLKNNKPKAVVCCSVPVTGPYPGNVDWGGPNGEGAGGVAPPK
ncbi:hypothetical protein DPMN_170594 [Dreissena polymorpha]|uniref:Uncharacterized protein n=1 Tax=Dreissena polymorpha TaxID=45954 RepID=A0A9D4DXM3_DREPO|nr:hypothetical protein DPMN_170594 [Dreissena polymorpha]